MRGIRYLGPLVAAALVLTACGTGEAGSAGPTSAGDGGSEAPSSGEGTDDQLRIALILPGETTDRGFNATGEQAAQLMEETYDADVTFTESVNPADQADVYRQYATQGYDLVIGWGGQFSDGAVEVSAEFPDTHFLVVSSNVENGSNLASYDTAIEDWQFLAGYLMARLSETGVVGQVSGQCFPSTAANQNGTRDGALYANPDIEWLATYTGDFEDPTKARQAAQAMIDEGADALHTNLNQAVFGVVQAAQGAENVYVVTEWLDNHDTAPDVIVAGLNKSYAAFVQNKVDDLVNGEWQGVHERFGIPEDWGPGIFDTDLLPDDIYEEVLEVQQQIASGEIDVERDETCPGQ